MLTLQFGDVFDVATKFTPESVAIAQGCNCFCTMGAGIAKVIKDNHPGAYDVDCDTLKGSRSKLGTFSYYDAEPYRIYNLYTQYTYNDPSDMFYISAFRSAMNLMIKDGLECGITDYVMPAIGLGLANGVMSEIVNALDDIAFNHLDVNIHLVVRDTQLYSQFIKNHRASFELL